MMISDLIDQVDFLEGLNARVPSLNWRDEFDLPGALRQAATLCDDAQWQTLNSWLEELTQDMQLLLPEIQSALREDWTEGKQLTSLLQHRLATS